MSVERTITSVLAAAGAEGQLHVVDIDLPPLRERPVTDPELRPPDGVEPGLT